MSGSLTSGLDSNSNGFIDLSQIDTDSDGINDFEDLCQGYNDNEDNNSNLIPDGCENISNTNDKESFDENTQLISPLNISIIGIVAAVFIGIILRKKLSG